jgi:hypothetical protein
MNDPLQRVTGWLLSDPVLRATASGHAAGVVNWLAPDGMHDGLYPEICGYYLQFLALAASDPHAAGAVEPSRAHDAAARIVAWLDEAGPDGDPLTLYYRDMGQSDWRNQCLFVFDLAIILRGFARVERRWPGLVSPVLMSRYTGSARRLVDNGRLASHRVRANVAADRIPAKWSTLPGVHHVKAAAALMDAERGKFAEVVAGTLAEEARALDCEGRSRMRELHPFLYLIEGWLTLWGQSGDAGSLARAAEAFALVLGEFDPDTGLLPAVAGQHEAVTRSDVLAQALRAGLVLEAAGQLEGIPNGFWAAARKGLRASLLSRISAEGGVEFDHVGRHRNVWASLFAWQALRFLVQAEARVLDPGKAAAALI